MAKYELLQIVCEKETILFASDKAYEIKRRYDPDKGQRIRINGRILYIYQAWDWVNGRPIKEYKYEVKPKKPEKTSNQKPVIQINNAGLTIKTFPSLTFASVELGYCRMNDISKACYTGLPTTKGHYFKWGKEA